MDPYEISKLCAELSINGKEEKLWSVQDTDNTYLFYFRNQGDRFRVLSGGPWSFDNCLLVLEKLSGVGEIARLPFNRVVFWVQIINAPLLCMTKEIGEFIGRCLGDLVDIDVGVTGECFGKYIRLRVSIDISKPLKRFLRLELKKGEESMVLFRYERLLEYCFHCGYIGHSYQLCQSRKESNSFDSRKGFEFGRWMRATGVPGQNKGAERISQQESGNEPLEYIWDQLVAMEEEQPGRVRNKMDGNVAVEEREMVHPGVQIPGSREESCVDTGPGVDAGLCPPLILSDVLMESYFCVKPGSNERGDRDCSSLKGKGIEVTKKKGKWKRWAREWGVREEVRLAANIDGSAAVLESASFFDFVLFCQGKMEVKVFEAKAFLGEFHGASQRDIKPGVKATASHG
ncbi:hypothetical protein EZV62_014583 [Acer yangbiense]|uniref:Zinc knuckle CX2CX4HX4C domain-containing protein n=1 Tax=Acer yangbiense TaxID=1000413 RepID=A0A5C7HSN9_9ROSI|nr:hypothetical protein EZV62_014583 [Acer yangbiense]